jgi:hypothetical protein
MALKKSLASPALACFDTDGASSVIPAAMDGTAQAADSRGAIPGTGDTAFTLHVPAGMPLPVIIAAPHGGRRYPPAILAAMRDPQFAALRLEDRHVDRLAEGVARATGAALLTAHAPRAMLDLNRSP